MKWVFGDPCRLFIVQGAHIFFVRSFYGRGLNQNAEKIPQIHSPSPTGHDAATLLSSKKVGRLGSRPWPCHFDDFSSLIEDTKAVGLAAKISHVSSSMLWCHCSPRTEPLALAATSNCMNRRSHDWNLVRGDGSSPTRVKAPHAYRRMHQPAVRYAPLVSRETARIERLMCCQLC